MTKCPYHSQYDNETHINRTGIKKYLFSLCNCKEEKNNE